MDTDSWFNTGTHRCTPDIAGWYIVLGSVCYLTPEDGARYYCNLAESGVIKTRAQTYSAGTDATGLTVKSQDIIYCDGSVDYISLFTYHDSSANKDIDAESSRTYLVVIGPL